MGLDLTLMPFRVRDVKDWAIAHTMIDCNRSSALFEAIMDAVKHHEQRVPRYFATFRGRGQDGETGYGNTQDTPYGEPLTWVPVRVLMEFADHSDVANDPDNRAVWAYLAALEPNMPVALYWH